MKTSIKLYQRDNLSCQYVFKKQKYEKIKIFLELEKQEMNKRNYS